MWKIKLAHEITCFLCGNMARPEKQARTHLSESGIHAVLKFIVKLSVNSNETENVPLKEMTCDINCQTLQHASNSLIAMFCCFSKKAQLLF